MTSSRIFYNEPYRVYLGRDENGTKAAIKIIKPDTLAFMDISEIEREIDVLKELDHPRVTRLLDYGETELTTRGRSFTVYHIALELAKGGELFDFISTTGAFTEDI